MSHNWPLASIAECAANEPYSTQIGPFGDKIRAETYTSHGAPVLRGTNVNTDERFFDDGFVFVSEATAKTDFANFLCRSGDVILCHKGTLGKIGLIPRNSRFEQYVMGNSMMRVRCNPAKLLPAYLYYWLSSKDGTNYLLSRVSQVGVPQIQRPLSTLREARFPLPPLTVQHRIVEILGALDDKFELSRRMNETLEAMARALFKSWFVDFERSAGVLPAGWRQGSIDDVAELNPESWSSRTRPESIEYVDLSNTKWGRIEATTTFAAADAPSRAQRVLRSGDSIVGTVRPGNGSFSLVRRGGLTGSTGFAVLRPRHPTGSAFVYMAATRPETISTLAHLADGGAYPAVRPEIVAQQPVVVPTAQDLDQFAAVVDPLFARIGHGEEESRTLAELRDLLLPKLLSGELQVREAERAVEAVA